MNRILAISIVVLGVVAGTFYCLWKSTKTELTAANTKISELSKQVRGYENEISKYNEAQEKASEKIEKVRTIVRTVKSDCDCYNTPIPGDVRRLLNGK